MLLREQPGGRSSRARQERRDTRARTRRGGCGGTPVRDAFSAVDSSRIVPRTGEWR
jgi:hypothetical protein